MKGKGVLIIIIVVLLVMLFSKCNCLGENEYEKAGREFSSWVNTDPAKWTSVQKQYYNDFMNYALGK